MSRKRDVDVLVTGASGFIGSRAASYLSQGWATAGTWHSNQAISIKDCYWLQLDIEEPGDVRDSIAYELRPRVVIHVAGTKDIAFCKEEPSAAWHLNVGGTRNVVEACREIGSRIVYISSDTVYSGQKERYSEVDYAEPFNAYGATKLAGEKLVSESGLSSLVIRCSLLFGWALMRQTSNYVLEVLRALEQGRQYVAAENLYNTPVLIDFAAEVIGELAMGPAQGIINLGGRDRLSRFSFARSVARNFSLDDAGVVPIRERDGLRQTNSCLDCTKLENLTGYRMWGVEDGLQKMASSRHLFCGTRNATAELGAFRDSESVAPE